MLKKLALVAAVFAGVGTAHAYQAEVGASLAYIDPDSADSIVGFAVDGTYYFNPVQIKNSPLNEAAFLNRASNVNANFGYASNDDVKLYNFGLGAEFFIPDSDLYARVNFSHNEAEHGFGSFSVDTELQTYSAEIGYLPTPGLLLAAGLSGWDNDVEDGIDPTLRAKFVGPFGNNNVNLEAYIGFGDLDEFRLQADYYINRSLSIGADYYDNDAVDEFGLNIKKFINTQTSLEARVGFADAEDNFSLRAAYRF